MDRTAAVLAEEDLIDIGVHEIGLAEVRIERHRHDRLAQLARQRLARGEKVAAHQLLGEGAGALLDLSGARVHPQRAQNSLWIDAVVSVELAVLDRLERCGQERRHLIGLHHDPILAVDREDAADQQRLEPDHRQLVSLTVAQILHAAGTRRDGEQQRIALLVRKARGAQRHVEPVALQAVSPRTIGQRDAPVMQPLQLVLERRLRERQPRVQLQRRRIHLGRQCPAPPLELPHDHAVEVQHVQRAGGEPRAHEQQQQSSQMKSSGAGARRL